MKIMRVNVKKTHLKKINLEKGREFLWFGMTIENLSFLCNKEGLLCLLPKNTSLKWKGCKNTIP